MSLDIVASRTEDLIPGIVMVRVRGQNRRQYGSNPHERVDTDSGFGDTETGFEETTGIHPRLPDGNVTQPDFKII